MDKKHTTEGQGRPKGLFDEQLKREQQEKQVEGGKEHVPDSKR